MKIQRIGRIEGDQDGAIWGSELFRFDSEGNAWVYDLNELREGSETELSAFARFRLDRAEEITPHCNSVCFGTELYGEGDAYPLLYANVYNSYQNEEDKRLGTCLVYRLQREEQGFRSTLVQTIRVGFCEDPALWRMSPEAHGVRPYGNFAVDKAGGALWAFVMRSESLGSRYFRFRLPSLREGAEVVLTEADLLEYFDGGYHHYMQGAALFGGRIYSAEGFSSHPVHRPALRVVDLAAKEERYVELATFGLTNEPECIDFFGEVCIYSDAHGNLYRIDWE